jgi:hypothetical protein
VDRVYHQFVRPVLEEILLAPKERSSLNERVEGIFIRSFSMREQDFPSAVISDWKDIQSARRRPLNPQIAKQYENKLISKPHAVSLSLKRKECKAVIQSFLRIADAVTKRKGAKEAEGIQD